MTRQLATSYLTMRVAAGTCPMSRGKESAWAQEFDAGEAAGAIRATVKAAPQ